jgi:CBS domain containing-hemolysin-like protein
VNSETVLDILLLVLLLLFSAFFSSAETSLTTANRIRIRTLADQGNGRARTLLKILEEPEKMLSTILVGNNIVNLYASALATSLTIRVFGSRLVGIATGILTLAVLVFGEITPKTMATHRADDMALFFAGPVSLLMVVMRPLVVAVNGLSGLVLRILGDDPGAGRDTMTEEELRAIVQVSHEDGVLEKEEKKIIDNVFDFGDTMARDIMIPRIDMTVVMEDADYEELLAVFRKDKYTRIPVCRGSSDTVVGIINVKDLLLRDPEKTFRIADYMREPLFTFERKKTSELMVEMRKNFTTIAIVLDDYGVTSGMITMEDLLEEIVGEIRDEYDTDEGKQIRRVGEDEYLMDGNLKLVDLNSQLDLSLDSENVESVGGYVTELLDRVPKAGDQVEAKGLRFTVLRMDKNRVEELRMKILPSEEEKIG